MAALSSPYLHLKVAIAVDDDATNLADVMWAATTRANYGKDLLTVSGVRMHPLDWSSDSIDLDIPGSDYQRVATKVGIDATKGLGEGRYHGFYKIVVVYSGFQDRFWLVAPWVQDQELTRG